MQKINSESITLIEERSRNTIEDIQAQFGLVRRLFVCDFHLEGIEKGEEIPGGYRVENVINIDHHAAVPRMRRFISSANLSMDYVSDAGTAEESDVVIINHTDCDSILSSGIIRGLLLADPIFGEAAIAADHTGHENKIADLLQGMSELRSITSSLRNLNLFLNKKDLEQKTGQLLDKRMKERESLRKYIEQGRVEKIGHVHLLVTDKKVDAGLIPAFIPEAKIIMVATPYPEMNKWEVAIRLGLARPVGFTLDSFSVNDIDPAYGGRWNAGSNRRGGGTQIRPVEYAQALNSTLEEQK